MTAIKGQTRIWARSPYFINCVPTTSETIVSATLTITIQTGSRNNSVTSMTDLKTYTLTNTNTVEGIVVFDIAPVVADYFDHLQSTVDDTSLTYANIRQIVFVKVVKSVVDTDTTTETTTYYVAVDGYSEFVDGVNYSPTTGATGNYGSPTWSPTAMKRTERTIAATDCYRQMGENSYAMLPIYMGEFDINATDSATFARVKFGAGEGWLTYSLSEVASSHIYSIVASDSRLTDVYQGLVYVPIGKKNMGGNWKSGYDYLRVAHMIDRNQTSSGAELVDIIVDPDDMTSSSGGANLAIDIRDYQPVSPAEGQDFSVTIPAFTDCAVSWSAVTFLASYQSLVGDILTLTIPFANQPQADCYANSAVKPIDNMTIEDYPIIEESNDIAVVNDNPILRYEIICEPKHEVIDCFFINRFGAWDCFSFLKKSTQSLQVQSKSYQRNIGTVSANAYTYDPTKSGTQRFSTQGRKTIRVNTGFVHESFSLLLEEIMYSERIILVIDDVWTPVNIKTESVELLKSVNDKLINYTIEFEYSNQSINNIV